MQFSTLIGLDRPKEIVQRSVDSGRLSHALLLQGPEGNGKLAFANAIASYLNCTQKTGGDSCGICPDCQKTAKLIHPDVHIILPVPGITGIQEDQSPSAEYIAKFRPRFLENPLLELEDWIKVLDSENKQFIIPIQEIRILKRKLSLRAFEGRYKVVLIWNAEKIRVEAANALLKLLEEPPDNTILILTVSDFSNLLPTITSRCQNILLNRISPQNIQQFLIEKFNLEAEQALQIALMSDGSLRKAVSLKENETHAISEKFPHWMRLCYDANYLEIAKLAEYFSRENKEFQKFFMESALYKVRDTLRARFLSNEQLLFPENDLVFLKKLNSSLTEDKLEAISELIDEAVYFINRNANVQMLFITLSLKIHKVFKEKNPLGILYR